MQRGQIIHLIQGKYSFEIMEKQLQELIVAYPFLLQSEIGKSVDGRSLYCIELGYGPRKVHVNGAHHANEWITSFVLLRSLEYMCKGYIQEITIGKWDMMQLLSEATFDFVPMVNPDGVTLCQEGLALQEDKMKKQHLYEANEGLKEFARWKANIRGVDLNRNYDAGFSAYQQISDVEAPSFAYYPGAMPESEPESKALANLTRKRQYDLVLAYHTQGQVIYWNYIDYHIETAKEYATMFSKASGYALDEPELMASSGGYKDWFIETFHKPGFTIECGSGRNPIDISQADEIIRHTLPILLLAGKDIRKEDL